MNLNDLLRRADELLSKGNDVLRTRRSGSHIDSVDPTIFYEFRSSCLAFLLMVFGVKHPYYQEFNDQCKGSFPNDVERGLGVLQGVRTELHGGWLVTAKGLVTAEIFGDFLEMAVYLLSENYKDPAAVVAGSVLEEHLRQLCIKHVIDVTYKDKAGNVQPKKADTLNADLSNAAVYNKLDHKNVTAWLDLRNKAAHGRYSDYTKDQVELMVAGIRDFLTRNPI